MSFLSKIKWNEVGLIPVIAQDYQSKKVLMMAWMNKTSLRLTIDSGFAVYWSRSRNKLWHKGEESGNRQKIVEIRLDCDNDVILLKIKQAGGISCHTGRHNCFYQKLVDNQWQITDEIIKDPKEIYKKDA